MHLRYPIEAGSNVVLVEGIDVSGALTRVFVERGRAKGTPDRLG
jgi:hypothetical protein